MPHLIFASYDVYEGVFHLVWSRSISGMNGRHTSTRRIEEPLLDTLGACLALLFWQKYGPAGY